MEKIVTKIGDVTIERKVSKTSLQKFSADATHRGILPQSAARSTLDDLVKSLPQSEVLKTDAPSPQHGVNARTGKALNAQTQMGKSLDVQSEMEQKFTLPKGISWDCKSSENSRQRTGNWNQLDSRAGAKIQFNNTCQSQKRIDQTGAMQPDMSRFGGISIERKRARVPENEPEEGQLSGNSRFSSGSGAQNVEVFNRDQSNLPGKGFPYPDIERLTQGGLTIEKKTNSQADPKQFRANSHNSINSSAQRFTGKPTFSSKSPIQISSDEDKGTAEDYGMKDADFEEDYDNETEDDEEEEEEISERNRFFNSESVPLQAEREGKQQENRSGSPIVLSSEDDEKNDEDVMVMDESQLINLNSKSDNLSVKSKSSESIVIDDLRDSSAKNIESGGASRIKVPQTSKLGCLEPKSESDILSSDVELDSDDVKALDDSNELGEEFSEMEEEEQMKETISDGEKLKEENEQSSPEDEADEPKNAQEDEESELKSSETELPPSDASEAEDEKTKADDVANDIVCDDLMELMKKGEIEGEVEDEKEYETEEEGTDKKGEKRKAEEEDGGNEKTETKSKSKKKKSEKTEEGESKDEDDKNIDKSKVTSANLRKNIREVMDETKLDEATLSAQRQEAERLKRLQDQQRIIRELQKQIVLNRNQKFQGRVMSLLQGNSQTSILKTSSASTPQSTTQSKSSNHVLVKLSNGQQTSLNNKKMLELLKNAKNKVALTKPAIPKTLLKQGMVSPSVSIAPIAKKEPPVDDKKKKKGDVVTLSSDSEDDCIVLSEEDESEPEEDPTNSGMHTSDKYNVPDDQGRVIVNVGHPESESDIYLAPQIARIIKPHQIGGIRFLYDNVIESVDRFQSSTGFGCILAHSMGLGKTLQIVSFSDIFLRYTSAKTILCIMPINTIQNWLAEFNMWLPKENNSSQEVRCRDFDLYIVNESLKNINSRSKVILDWHRNGGVLLMGYELFRLLSLKKSYKSKKKKKETDEKEDEAKNKELMEEVYAALVRPGPDLVICDEGHRIKNSHATTSQALKQIRTKRRIVLTGYPLQNNLLEYWCMVDFVRPNYLGSKTEFSNMFERPIQNGQCIDSTPQDKRLMRYRAHVLHSLLEGFVQRRSHAVLQSTLPEKEEYVLLLRFTPFQRKLYDTFMNEVVRTVAVPNPLKAFAVCCKIWNHPDVLYNFLKKKGEEIDLDLEEALPPSMQQPANYPFGQTPPDGSTQFPPSQAVQPWPKRGPGSRGGKVRQCAMNRRPGRGRKPAATVSPNLTSEKKDQDPEFNPSSYPSNYPDFQHQNSTESMMDSNRNRNFGRPFSQYPTSDYGSHSSFSGSSYESKNPLENLEDLSSGDFQSKRFYPQQSDSGMQNNFSNPSCMQQNTNYPQSMNQSGNADMNSGFNRNDTSKPFQYNQNYNSGYYPGGNYQSQKTPEFEQTNKQPNFNRNNQSTDPYYQNTQYPDGRDPSMNYNMQSNSNMDYQYGSGNSDQNYQQGNMNKHFQNSNPGYNDSSCNPNYQNSRPADSNYQSDFQGPNFQNSSSGFNQTSQERDSGFNKQQEYWSGSNWFDASKGSGDSNYNREKYGAFEGDKDGKKPVGDEADQKSKPGFGVRVKSETELESNFGRFEDDKGGKAKDEGKKEEEFKAEKKEEFKSPEVSTKKEDSLPYDWATDLFKNYVTGIIENSSKMEVFFHILTESIKLGDRLLVFSQSLLTLDLIEDYLHRCNVPNKDEKWAKNRNYFRLDGSTPGLEREKLINEFNSNPNVFIFLVSTRAGSLGINLVGANRVVVFDASWNPCHDTQAVCRVYRYGQQKPCFVYRLVMDSCLEKKIYDRQINKQGMADRVVDELNPDAHLSIKEVTNLCWDDQEDTTVKDFSYLKDKYNDQIIKVLIENCSKLLSKEPFQHESLLIDRKEKKLSQAEKRLAKRSYELEKQAANQPKNIYSFFPNSGGPRNFGKPIASVRPMQNEMATRVPPMANRSKWIPAEVWQKQGMSAQEMTLPLDVVIPTNTPEKTSIVLKAGQRVMVLKSPKGIYMQLENGKIIAIRTAFKVGQGSPGSQTKGDDLKKDGSVSVSTSLKNNPNVTITSKQSNSSKVVNTKPPFVRAPDKKMPLNITAARSKQLLGKTKPFLLNRKFQTVTPEIRQRLMANKPKFDNQEEKTGSSSDKDDVIVTSDTNESFKPAQDDDNRVGEDQSASKGESSLETLRKVTESIRDKTDGNNDGSQVQMNLKNFRHNFSSQLENKTQDSDDDKEVKMVGEVSSAKTGDESSFNGNENVQNWLMNQPYPAVDPYSNYFPSYYPYGHGAGSMGSAYEGYYQNNYGMGNKEAQADNSKTVPYQQNRTGASQNVQQSRNPVYPPYSNPYQQYSHNYPNNPGYTNQGYQFPQNQQQQQASSNPGNTPNSSQQNQSYDNSMYSAFHRPDGHYQGSDNSYSTPYRPPYPSNATPGFFPYNAPYRPYPDPNYHYNPNFNPYMHPPGYGYSPQNPQTNNNRNPSFNQHSTEPATNTS